MGIRRANAGDVAELRRIYAPYVEHTTISYEYEVPSEEEFRRRYETVTGQFPWIVWEEQGELLGYAYASPAFARRGYGFLADLSIYLREDARGRGIGRKLYAALERIVYRQGYRRLYAIICAENTGSCHFHERLGYSRFACFARSGVKFGRWLDTVWYEKILRDEEEVEPFPISWNRIPEAELQQLLCWEDPKQPDVC